MSVLLKKSLTSNALFLSKINSLVGCTLLTGTHLATAYLNDYTIEDLFYPPTLQSLLNNAIS